MFVQDINLTSGIHNAAVWSADARQAQFKHSMWECVAAALARLRLRLRTNAVRLQSPLRIEGLNGSSAHVVGHMRQYTLFERGEKAHTPYIGR